VGGKTFVTNNADLSGMRALLVSKATGEPVKLVAPSASYSYSSGVSGVSVMEFDIGKPGLYQFSAWYEGRGGPEVVLAIGKGFGERIWGAVTQGIAILSGAIGLSVAIGAIVFLKRRKAVKSTTLLPAAGEASAIDPS
jgi:hypothetical protein